MYINSLEVGNFRNYEFAKIDFSGKTNILYGDNAQEIGRASCRERVWR